MNSGLKWLARESNSGQIALLLFCIAMTVRLIALMVMPEAHVSSNARESILGGAALILDGQFIRNPDYPMLVPPLTALFTAAIQFVFGDNLIAIKLCQIVLDSCAVVLLFLIGREIFGHTCAVLGSGALTVYPFAVFVPLYVGTEGLFGFLLSLFLFLFIKGLKEDALSLLFASGFVLGLATLTRGTTLFLPLFLMPFLWWHYHERPISRNLQSSAWLIIGFVVILSPWIARNYVVHGAFIPSSTSSGPLLHGSSEDFWLIKDRERNLQGYFDYLRDEKGIEGPSDPNPTWVEKDNYYKRAAIEMYKDRWSAAPLSFLPFIGKKFVRLWYATETGNNTAVIAAINLPIYILFLIGFWASIRNRIGLSYLLTTLLLYFVVLHVLVFGYFRYMIPVMPFMILFGAYGLLNLVLDWRKATYRPGLHV